MSDERKIYKGGLALFVLAGAFSIASFFNYNPWDFYRFIHMLAYDNVSVTAANTILTNMKYYIWRIPSSVGLGSFIFIIIGAIVLLRRYKKNLSIKVDVSIFIDGLKRIIRNPNTIIITGLIVQFLLVIRMGVSADRHLLFLVPLLCFFAAIGFQSLCSTLRTRKNVLFGIGILVFAYQLYNAIGLELIYLNDVRLNAVKWLDSRKINPDKVTAYMIYSRLRPEYSKSDKLNTTYYFITCDLEYVRYFSNDDPKKIFHLYGGQNRFKFFRDLFSNKLNFRIAEEFKQKKYTLEQFLMGYNILLPLETFTPQKCIIFQRIQR